MGMREKIVVFIPMVQLCQTMGISLMNNFGAALAYSSGLWSAWDRTPVMNWQSTRCIAPSVLCVHGDVQLHRSR